jgi:hypothetical protein
MRTKHLLPALGIVAHFVGVVMRAANAPSSVGELAVLERFLCLSDAERKTFEVFTK